VFSVAQAVLALAAHSPRPATAGELAAAARLEQARREAVADVTACLDMHKFNVAIAGLHKLTNALVDFCDQHSHLARAPARTSTHSTQTDTH
jgi:hypothetical protein